MKVTKTLSILATTLVASVNSAHAQAGGNTFDFGSNSTGNYRQGPAGVSFEGGTFNIGVRDGNFAFEAGCALDEYFPPGAKPPAWPIGPCALGATGFLTAGDIDGDGLEDAGTYYGVSQIAAAVLLRPFQPEQVRLVSAPPSLLPRPLGGFINDSRSVFYNIQTASIRQYDITIYEYDRAYSAADRNRFDKEIVPGTYRFNLPSLASTTIPAVISINLFPTLDGYRKINSQNQGFRFTNVTYDDGFAVLNPFQINTLTWEGNNFGFISPALDILYFSIKRLADPTDPLSDPDFGLPIFPNFDAPGVTRVRLANPIVQKYTLAPNFLLPGTTGIVDLEFILNRPTTAVIGDRAIRRFRLPVRVIDPFVIPPPPVNGATVNVSAADSDGDGISNFSEWVFGSDRNSAASVPTSPALSLVRPAASTNEVGGDSTGARWEYKVEKKQNPVPKLTYVIERSTDMKTWTAVPNSDPNWEVTETYKEIKVTSRNPEITGGGFFRASVRAN